MKEIVQEPTPVLRETARAVPEEWFGSEKLTRLVEDMSRALDREPEGVALAAPQVAVPYRMFIVRMDRTRPVAPAAQGEKAPPPEPEVEAYINPEIVKRSRRSSRVEEGCLSVRGVYGLARRHERVTLRARRVDGTSVTRGAGGLLAQIFEHELDHLNGVLFIDHAENLVRLTHGVAA